jgi:hypothetical protein
MEFVEWLIENKGVSRKSAHDVASRFRRLQKISNIKDVNKMSMDNIEKKKSFQELSVGVRSQLRRAYALMKEFNEQ